MVEWLPRDRTGGKGTQLTPWRDGIKKLDVKNGLEHRTTGAFGSTWRGLRPAVGIKG